MRNTRAGAILALLAVAGCGSSAQPTGVATNPPIQDSGGGSANASPGAQGTSGVRTVLSPLGLNIHSDASVTAARIGTAGQGAVLSVLGHSDQNGGWYRVHGQTVIGWITADPALTAAGRFVLYQSTDRQFNALYPDNWSFAESPAFASFHPINGPQAIMVRNGAQTSDFGAPGAPGYTGAGEQVVVVCGVTANLDQYARTPGAPSPSPGAIATLPRLAEIRLRLDAAHAMALDYSYSAAADIQAFEDFYNSMTFPFPQCQAPAPASPTAS